MKRFRVCVGAAALLTALVPLPASAGSGDHDIPDRIELPNGWQPEGITTDGEFLYAGSLADGAIWRANPRTGAGDVLASGKTGRVAVGVDYDRRRDLLWVAGGPTSEIRAQDADTGKVLATYSFPSSTARFLNDLVVTRRGVYATDSLNQELAVVPLKHGHGHGPCDGRGDGRDDASHDEVGHEDDGRCDDGDDANERRTGGWSTHHGNRLPPASAARTLPLTGDLMYETGFNLNGIVASDGKLLAVQSNPGKLFSINRKTGNTTEVDLGGELLTNGDGLELDGDIVYVVRNFDNLIAVVELDDDLTRGQLKAQLTDVDLDIPTTVALLRHSLYAVNARFEVAPTPDTAYWVTRLDEFDD
ncbi:MAG: superoxide dismutase [Propionibacteriales bacterium]|nr:superoxide dismutase [Propionibacteriales bacterium]